MKGSGEYANAMKGSTNIFYVISNKIFYVITQSVFTCSELTIETLEQGVKYVQS